MNTLELTDVTISMLDRYFINHESDFMYTNGDLEFVVMLMRGLLKNYETIHTNHIRKGLYYLHKCIFAH